MPPDDQNQQDQPTPYPMGDQGMPNIPVNEELASRVTALYAEMDRVLADLNVPEKEKKEVEQNLMSAIAADLLTRLGTRLTDEQKQQFAETAQMREGEEPDLNAIAGFFRSIFSQEELVNEVAAATESVLSDFIKEMDR